jgi:integrase
MRTPSYRLHKPSGQAVVTLNGEDVYLGKHGTAESKGEYDRLIAEWLANGRRRPARIDGPTPAGSTVNELLVGFVAHARQHYRRPDGSLTNEYDEYRMAFRPLKHLYGDTPVKDFGPLSLKAVRELMVTGYEHPKYGGQQALARGVVNQRVGRIVRAFKWGVENELVPAAVFQALKAVRGLAKGRSPARETEPVKPVPEAYVEAVLPFVLPPVRAMIRLQRLTGMRPGEACALRACDIDMTGPVWLYRPEQHKTSWRGHERVIALGPRAQEVLRPFLTLNTQAYLFSPWDAVRTLREGQRAKRRTKVQPSQVCRKKKNPKRKPGERYSTHAYLIAIRRGCEAADRAAHKANPAAKPEEVLLPYWHPNQLRHQHGTEVRRRFGLEAAQVALGHAKADVTQVYAERNLTLAVQVAAQIG